VFRVRHRLENQRPDQDILSLKKVGDFVFVYLLPEGLAATLPLMKHLPAKLRNAIQGFTLIELLVVIAILAILMSLLFPAMQSVMDTARRASAQNDVVQIANAVVMYETEYGRLPPENTVVGGNLLNALINEGAATNNPRRVRFLDAQNFRRNRGGVADAGSDGARYLDPWEGEYKIAMNTDYENSISVGGGDDAPEQEDIRKQVGVWNTNATPRLRVKSW